MKKLLIGIFTLFILASCGMFSGNATIVRDCSGTYLRMDSLDYMICNPAKVESYENGSAIAVKYQTVEECNFSGSVCLLYHESHGNIKITSIKK